MTEEIDANEYMSDSETAAANTNNAGGAAQSPFTPAPGDSQGGAPTPSAATTTMGFNPAADMDPELMNAVASGSGTRNGEPSTATTTNGTPAPAARDGDAEDEDSSDGSGIDNDLADELERAIAKGYADEDDDEDEEDESSEEDSDSDAAAGGKKKKVAANATSAPKAAASNTTTGNGQASGDDGSDSDMGGLFGSGSEDGGKQVCRFETFLDVRD